MIPTNIAALLVLFLAVGLTGCGSEDDETPRTDAGADVLSGDALADDATHREDAPFDPDSPDDAEDTDADAHAADAADVDAEGDAASEPPLCSSDYGPVSPVSTDDATFDAWETFLCLPSKEQLCRVPAPEMLEKLLRCEPVEGGWFWEQGSAALRTVGRAGGACLFDVMAEIEGAARISRCTVPMPMTPWAGLSAKAGGESIDAPLAGIESSCVTTGTCSLLAGAPNECAHVSPLPPLCEDFLSRGGEEDR